jgi:hypothetical protein
VYTSNIFPFVQTTFAHVYPFHTKGGAHSHVLLFKFHDLPFRQPIQFDPSQFNVGGHSQLLVIGFKYCPAGHIITHAVPFHCLPVPQFTHVPSGARAVPIGQVDMQLPLKKMGFPTQSWHSDPVKKIKLKEKYWSKFTLLPIDRSKLKA